MLMNRRTMLTYSMATVAMTLTGCKRVITTVVVKNSSNVDLSLIPVLGAGGKVTIDAEVDGGTRVFRFRKKNIALGKSAKRKYSVKGAVKGTEVPFVVNNLT